MLSLQSNQSKTMQVFITPDHDSQFIQHDRIVELTESEIDELIAAGKQGEYDLHVNAYGEDYAACVMSDLIMD